MKTPAHDPHAQTAGSDAALRTRLRASLAGAPQPELQALEHRVMAQWQLRGVHGGLQPQGSGGVLALAWRARALLAGLAVLALVAAVGLQQVQKNGRAAMDELAEPDVLSLISLGEL